jgi:glycosyltransferase involved in cell wall biosynthesis
MYPEEMASLYRHPTVKALVSLTRGEGWGLPLLEATGSGLPVIATNWSGHLDFLSHGRFIPINYSLTTIPKSRVDDRIFMPGAQWAQPDEADVKSKLKKFRSHPRVPQKWAQDLMSKILEKYSQEQINKIYSRAIGDLIR